MTDGTERESTRDPSQGGGYRAVVERYRDRPNQCTIFPAGLDGSERVTTWITATEPTFVDLRSVR